MERRYSFMELYNLAYDNSGKLNIKLTREEIESIMDKSYEHFGFLCLVLKTHLFLIRRQYAAKLLCVLLQGQF